MYETANATPASRLAKTPHKRARVCKELTGCVAALHTVLALAPLSVMTAEIVQVWGGAVHMHPETITPLLLIRKN